MSLKHMARRLPMIFQAESNECGLACLAMVASYHGSAATLNGLRSHLGSHALGTSAAHLLDLAGRMKLRGRALKIELDDLARLSLPAIIHWDLDHYVVLKKVGKHKALIHDPAAGVRKYEIGELSLHFTGIALVFQPLSDFSRVEISTGLHLKELLGSVKISANSVVLVFVMTFLLQLFALLNPLYLQLVIDQGLVKGDTELIMMLAIMFVVLVIMKSALAHMRGMHLVNFSNEVGLQLVSDVSSHLSRLPLRYFERREMGDIVSRFGSLDNIRRLITQEMITVIVDGLFSLITLVLLYLYSPLLASTVLVAVVLFVTLRLASISHERDLRHESLLTSARQQSRFMENIRCAGVARTYAIDTSRHNAWEQRYIEQLNCGLRLDYFCLSLGSAQSLLLGLENVITIYLGATAVAGGNLSVGQLMSFIFLKQHFLGSVLAMFPKLSDIRLLNLDLERVADLVQHDPKNPAAASSLLPAPVNNEICLDDLGFRYDGQDAFVFSNISFTIAPGEAIALTGPSGSGKSTLLKLLLALESPTQGSIRIGGRDLQRINCIDLRTRISAILHSDGLLAGDLAYNIHLDVHPVDWTRIDQLSNSLGLQELVESLPLAFATEVGELGSMLSAGQVQRILLARALYREPGILLLDEAFSNLNTEAALAILENIKQMNLSLLLVTHNKELIQNVDRVLKIN